QGCRRDGGDRHPEHAVGSMPSARLPFVLLLAALLAPATGWVASAWAQETAVVSSRVIYPGEIVEPEALQEVALHRRPKTAIVHAKAEIEGKVARRTLLPGRLIPQGSVREPYLVETGSPVTVMFVQGGLTISTV